MALHANAVVIDEVLLDAEREPWRVNLNKTSIALTSPRPLNWWTGLPPEKTPGFKNGKLYSLPILNLATCTREEVRDYFNNGWTLTETMFSSLVSDEAFYRPPYHGLRHPFIFYYGHPAVLYVQKLQLAGLIDSGINAYFERIFEIGVDEMSWDDMSKNDMEWPAVDQVLEYRKQVYKHVLNVIDSHPDLEDRHAPILMEHPLWALFMSFEHERIHLETSSVLIREFPLNLVSRPDEWPANAPTCSDLHREMQMVPVKAHTVKFGKPINWPTYGWDNEYGERTQAVDEFFVSNSLISNADYLEFVKDGGYQRPELWTETGWRWRSYRNVCHPTFWIEDGLNSSRNYNLRACFEVIAMPWQWPVVVNFHEAKAFCKWKSIVDQRHYRLPTEAEHHALRIACDQPNHDQTSLIVSPTYNINLRFGSESNVIGFDNVGSPINDLFGNLWQWLEDHFSPLDGSQPHPYYADFSTPCYDGEHQMIMGGSFVSTGDEATPWARFHFRPHFFQQAGFRIVYSPEGTFR